MKKTALLIGLLVSFGLTAGAEDKISYEVNDDYGYVVGARTKIGGNRTAHIDEQSNLFRIVVSPKTDIGLVRVGFEWQRFSFGLVPGTAIPNTLQSTSLVIGLDTQIGDTILLRIEAQPGFYSDFYDISGSRDFNVPFVIGGSYLYSDELQFVLGLSVDINRSIPVFPGVGVRWKFAEKWVLDAILPKPRVEYKASDAVTLYAGADLRGGTYRVGEKFGTAAGNSRLDSAIVEYTEVRVSAGLSWKLAPSTTFEFETGYMAYRGFNFDRADTGFSTTQGAPYGQVALGMKF
jgi:hypothetical protein